MANILAVIGKSNSGKTTLIERLVPRLRQRGLAVGTIKHASHGFDLDHEGKDSYRHKRSGAVATVVTGPEGLAVMRDSATWDVAGLVSRYLADMDLVLVEGFKSEDLAKIEISATGERLFADDDQNLQAIVSAVFVSSNKPVLARDDIEGIADFVYNFYKQNRPKSAVRIFVNGEPLAVKSFVGDMFYRVLVGMAGLLKGGEGMRRLMVDVTLEDEDASLKE
jgi:molybdopterin-guanine dinucleotide biosynthesis protein B